MEAVRIAIVGPESTGKSSLAQSLSKHYSDIWVPEFARTYLWELNKPYQYDDLLNIAKGQQESEDILFNAARQFLFCDTTILSVKIWSDFKYGKSDCWILDELELRKYQITLLCDIDLPWEDDPLRENPNDREQLLEIHKTELNYYQHKYEIIRGQHEQRLKNAVSIIDKLI
ncbi:MAG: ATP-binding protein [Bacteroidia bacterium]|nr:ATP-binding protein [Bacteroidia bacterium]